MTPAILRAQMSTSTDPARLEREARLIEAREAGVFAAGAGARAHLGVTEQTRPVVSELHGDKARVRK